MSSFAHQRHKPPLPLDRPRELVVACAPMKSHVNLSHIVRTAGCSGVARMIACGNVSLDAKITRDGADQVALEIHRTLPPVLRELREEGYRLVGLEQTTGSKLLTEYAFVRRTALVVGNERTGLTDDLLALIDDAVEIPVFGLPHSFNVATAAAMAMYEYCRQFPRG
ncbi:MAG: RNA methyltransferase [Planctomycetia bacterium]|nr:RNA methyltransferase [Planctomycetia bacterium]